MANDEKRSSDFRLADGFVWLAFCSLLLALGCAAMVYWQSGEESQQLTQPTPAAISQRMSMICPNVVDFAERVRCSTQVVDELSQKSQRAAELRNQSFANIQQLIVVGISLASLFITVAALGYLVRTFKATHQAALAAEVAAKAAADANVGFAESSRQQLRAYVAITQVRVDLVAGFLPRIYVDYRNVGQTPANRLQSQSSIAIVLKGESPDFNLLGDLMAARSLGPACDGTHIATKPSILTPQEADNIRRGGSEIVVWGRITYVDVFGTERTTSFRRKFGDRETGSGVVMMLHRSGGNEAT